MSHGDELLSWHACGRCQHVFLPPPDRLVICPACRAANGIPFNGDMRYALAGIRAWLEHHGWPPVHAMAGLVAPGTYSSEPLMLTPQRASVHVVEGHAVLWEEGLGADLTRMPDFAAMAFTRRSDRPDPEQYASFRMAAFFASPPTPEHQAAAERAWAPFAMLGRPRFSERGVHLICHPNAWTLQQQREAAARALAGFVRELGGEPVLQLTPSRTPGRIPDASRGERTIRCGQCGAPVKPDALTLEAPACPFCHAPIRIPPELHAEIAHYARTLRAQDPRWIFNATRFWQMWEQRPAEVIACAICGAPSSRRLGVVNARCGHCHALIVPSAARLQADVEDHRRVARQVEHMHARSAWSFSAGAHETDDAVRRALPTILVVGGTVVAMPMTAMFILKADVFYLGLGGRLLLLAGVIAAMMLAAWGALRLFRRLSTRRGARWREAFERVGEQLACAHGPGRGAVGAWCSRWWPQGIQPLPAQSYAHHVFHLDLGGLPAMVEVDAIGAGALRALVAAHWEPSAGALKDAPGVVERRRALWEAGFAIRLRRAGLEMHATPELIERLREDPSAIGIIVPVLYEIRRIMALLDARAPG